MRDLKYKEPYRLQHSTIEKGMHLYESKPLYFEKVSTVLTKNGIVVVYECDWSTNSFPLRATIFKAVVNGWVYTAELNEQRLTERQLKWLSTNFMRKILLNNKNSHL